MCVPVHMCVCVYVFPGANVNASRLHETPLHYAAKARRAETVELLVEFGANIYARDHRERRPVDYTTPDSPAAACLRSYESKTPVRTWGGSLTPSSLSLSHHSPSPHHFPLSSLSPSQHHFPLSSRLTGQHPIINFNVLHLLCM